MKNSNEHEGDALPHELSDKHFDDSVSERHQHELRTRVLQVFEQAAQQRALPVSRLPSTTHPVSAKGRHIAACVVTLAICLMALMSVGLPDRDPSLATSAIHVQSVPGIVEDPQFLVSLSGLDAFRDEMSRDEFFDAIAMCQLDHEARMMIDNVQPSADQTPL